MISADHSFNWFWNFIGISCENLLIMKLELHGFIGKHLPKLIALEQINQHEGSLAQFDLDPIHLNLFLDLPNDLWKRILAWTHRNLILLVMIIVRDIHHFYLHGFLPADLHCFVWNTQYGEVLLKNRSVPTIKAYACVLKSEVKCTLAQ